MATLESQLTWLSDGEKANATNLNRPLLELVQKLDGGTFDATVKTTAKAILASELNGVSEGDYVYKNSTSGKYEPAIADGTEAQNVVGQYRVINGNDFIVFGGVVNETADTYTEGSVYCLSPTVAGGITTDSYENAVQIGLAISARDLLIKGSGGSGGGGAASIRADGFNTAAVSTLDLVYIKNSDSSIQPAIADGTEAANVFGMFVTVNGVSSIVHSGIVTWTPDDLTIGTTYYLSPSSAGDLTDTYYTNAIKVGIALDTDKLLVDIDFPSVDTGAVASPEAYLRTDGYTIDGSVSSEDFVYIRNSDSNILPAIVDGTEKGNVFGVYLTNDPFDRVVHSGVITYTAGGLEPGKPYYLSSSVAGGIQVDTYPGAVKIGTALSANELLIDIDKSPTSNSTEEFEYQFLLSTTSYGQCTFDTFTELNTVTINGDASYSALNTSYIVQSGSNIETPANLITDGSTQYDFFLSVNDDGNFTYQYSIDSGSSWVDVPADGKFRIAAGVTNIILRFVSGAADAEIYSFGLLFEDDGFETVTRVKLREVLELSADLNSGNPVSIPYGKRYTNDGESLMIRIEGLTLIPGRDYNELNEFSVSFNFDLKKGDVIEFEEWYGYVDVSNENSARLDKIEENYLVKTEDYTAISRDIILADTTSSSINITLPIAPQQYEKITIKDIAGTFDINNLIIVRNGNTIMGLDEDMTLSTKYEKIELLYTGTDWRIL